MLVETTEGSSTLVAAPVDRGGMDAMMGLGMMGDNEPGGGNPVELLTLTVSGEHARAPRPVPEGPGLRDLRGEPITARRTLDFAMGMGGGAMMGGEEDTTMMAFTINGQEFDPNRVETPVAAGTVEEWTLKNSSPMDHPIHLHVWPMRITDDGGRHVPEPRWRDVVNVPARSQVCVLIAFEDFPGKTVYHCHILDHEDQGMMGTVEAR